MNGNLPKFAERGPIKDAAWVPLKFFNDARGWLAELFRVPTEALPTPCPSRHPFGTTAGLAPLPDGVP